MEASLSETTLSPSEIQVQLNVNAYISLIAFTLLYFDFSITFSREVSRYWGSRFTWPTFLFYLNRYASLVGNIPIMMEYFWTGSLGSKLKVCPNLQTQHQIVAVVAQVCIGLILIVRTYALYGRSRRILAFMFCVGGSVFGYAAWSAVSAKELPQPPANSYPLVGCPTSLSTETAHRMGYAWIGVLGFDVMILTLTIWKGYESCRKGNCVPERRRRGLIPTFVCDGVLYFLVVAVANLGNIMSYLFAPPYLRGVGSTMTTVLSTIMASRLMLNIRDPKLVSPGTFPTTMIGETRTSVIDDIPITTVFPYYGTGFSWTDEDAYGYYPYDGRSLDFSKEIPLNDFPPSS